MSYITPLSGFILAPLLFGIINRTKAFFAGRRGQLILQPYYDLWRLLRKGAVYSRTTSVVFRVAPVIILASVAIAMVFVPLGHTASAIHFEGDLILFIYLLALARIFTILAALDTGSSFEGMGASREALFSTLAEPALLLVLGTLAFITKKSSLNDIFGTLSVNHWITLSPSLAFILSTLIIVLLAENARIPVDDPNTHLELTMIHEVMVLDYSGPDFGLIQYSSALKLWIFASLVISVLLPVDCGRSFLNFFAAIGGIFIVSIIVGIIESTMARLRLIMVPQFLIGAAILAAIALVLAAY